MKLPNPFQKDTAASLQRAISERDAAEAKLAGLHTQRAAVLLDAELTEVEAIDRQIEAAHRTVSILADRILSLDARLSDEQRAAEEKAYASDIDKIERLLPMRAQAAVELEQSLKAVAAACRKYSEITASITNQWPASVAKPSYHLSLRPTGELIRNAYGHPSLVFRSTLAPMAAADFVRRACDADDRISGFADGEAKGHAELLIELRQRNAAPAAVIDDREEVAA
jgi:hypothetical protein